MSKFGYLSVPVILFAMTISANAQDGKGVHADADKAENTMDIELGGSAGLRYVFGTENVNFVRTVGASTEDGGTWPAWATISLNVAFSDSTSLHTSLYTGALGGTNGYAHPLGNAHSADTVAFQDLYVQFDDAFTEGLDVKIGSHAVSFGLMEGRETYNPRWSSLLSGTGAGTLTGPRALSEYNQAGLSLNYASENIGLDVFWTVIAEGGASSADETNTGVIFTYDLSGAVGEGSAFGAMVLWADLVSDANFFSFNPEVFLNGLMENLGLYIRLGFNFGEIATDVDASGISAGLGLTYSFANDSDAWIALMFDYNSGDDGSGDQESYLGYESTGDGKYDLLVLEGQLYGFNLTTNYWKVALSGGMSFSVGSGRNNLNVRGVLGTAMAVEEIGSEDNWGFEIDIVADYVLNDRVSWTTGIGAVLGSDLLDDQGGQGAMDDDDNAIVFFMGPDVSF